MPLELLGAMVAPELEPAGAAPVPLPDGVVRSVAVPDGLPLAAPPGVVKPVAELPPPDTPEGVMLPVAPLDVPVEVPLPPAEFVPPVLLSGIVPVAPPTAGFGVPSLGVA